MNSRDLVFTALRGQPTPRLPTGPLAVHFCAHLAGHRLRAYSTQASALAGSVLAYHHRFRPDAVWVSADTWVSAEAMGARVDHGADEDQPLGGTRDPVVRTAADIDRLPAPDVARQGRYPVILDALAQVVAGLGREACIVGCFDQYPFSLAAALMGLDEILVRCREDPPFVRALLERCEAFTVAYGQAMATAGADILSGGDSPAGLLGPALYEAVALPAEQHVIAALQATTRRPVSLHICGRTTRLLPRMAASGADILEIDHAVDLATACRAVGPKVTLWGNLDPVRVLAQGTPEEVRRQARTAVEAVRSAEHTRFVLSSGCTLAVETPAANLDALLTPES